MSGKNISIALAVVVVTASIVFLATQPRPIAHQTVGVVMLACTAMFDPILTSVLPQRWRSSIIMVATAYVAFVLWFLFIA